jgi:hypothetical protein
MFVFYFEYFTLSYWLHKAATNCFVKIFLMVRSSVVYATFVIGYVCILSVVHFTSAILCLMGRHELLV